MVMHSTASSSVGVLVPRRNRRQIAFRHNILFDYVASKLYLDPFKPGHLQQLFFVNADSASSLVPRSDTLCRNYGSDELDHALFLGPRHSCSSPTRTSIRSPAASRLGELASSQRR